MGSDNSAGIPPEERSSDLGAPDVMTMRSIRDLFVREEPLVETSQFDSVLDPQEIRVSFTDGIGDAEWCRVDITWYKSGAYRFHYVDERDVNWRFDNHPNPHSPTCHFHRPPDAPPETAEQSCIEVDEPRLVARAVLKLWRRAYEMDDLDILNTATNPP
ncbi:hypothetical protein OB955_23550 [Halobacteria archaeon AArc-m2/3/4]|uniref:Uncharacterized protein n=1 Tax=Natronoglomus mannanivorans TaxID=2979990 RepID=A0AAP2YYV0_9EURY|nr:hypothetical protein [Halobacteria archaeon AArc-xg1-1]MCU4975666.1 hypothetical protein [Halobacteria archaeon AArc-m2/3/4]